MQALFEYEKHKIQTGEFKPPTENLSSFFSYDNQVYQILCCPKAMHCDPLDKGYLSILSFCSKSWYNIARTMQDLGLA